MKCLIFLISAISLISFGAEIKCKDKQKAKENFYAICKTAISVREMQGVSVGQKKKEDATEKITDYCRCVSNKFNIEDVSDSKCEYPDFQYSLKNGGKLVNTEAFYSFFNEGKLKTRLELGCGLRPY